MEETMPEDEGRWPGVVKKDDLYKAYSTWCTNEARRKATTPNVLFKQLRKFGFESSRPRISGERVYVFGVPKLDVLQKHLKIQSGVRLGE
jgi:hypothetical protein